MFASAWWGTVCRSRASAVAWLGWRVSRLECEWATLIWKKPLGIRFSHRKKIHRSKNSCQRSFSDGNFEPPYKDALVFLPSLSSTKAIRANSYSCRAIGVPRIIIGYVPSRNWRRNPIQRDVTIPWRIRIGSNPPWLGFIASSNKI